MKSPTFEVACNRAGAWFVRERARNGEIVSHTQAYSNRSNARRAARRRAEQIPGATWAMAEAAPRFRFPPLH